MIDCFDRALELPDRLPSVGALLLCAFVEKLSAAAIDSKMYLEM